MKGFLFLVAIDLVMISCVATASNRAEHYATFKNKNANGASKTIGPLENGVYFSSVGYGGYGGLGGVGGAGGYGGYGGAGGYGGYAGAGGYGGYGGAGGYGGYGGAGGIGGNGGDSACACCLQMDCENKECNEDKLLNELES